MRSLFAPTRTACCVAVGLMLAVARGAEPPHPLIGATREQVLVRNGEPKGQIGVGNRTVLTYTRERIVLRDNVVVEVETIFADPVRRPPVVAPAEPVATATPSTPAIPVAPGASNPAAGAAAANNTPVGTENPPTPLAVPPAPAPAPASDSRVEIKLVRAPSAGGVAQPAPKREVPPPVAATPEPELVAAPVLPPTPDPAEVQRAAEKAARAAKAAADAAAQEKRLKSAQSARRRLDFAETAADDEGGMSKSAVLALVVIVGGLGALIWWRRQQALALAATTVANTPVKKPAVTAAKVAPVTSFAMAMASPAAKAGFTLEFLAQLDADRFEELVAAYFTKTGVVATRTKTGAASPVHIRISWKGEPRAFACAQCIVQTTEAIDARALQGLVAALAAENLRRGYVVSNGEFSAAAQKFATSKQLILLPADVLLEKIKGLPESARNELMQVLSAEKKAA